MIWFGILLNFITNEELLLKIGIVVLEKIVKSTKNDLDDKILEQVKLELEKIKK